MLPFYYILLVNDVLAGNFGVSSTVYNSVISTIQLLILFCILLVLLFMYVTYGCEINIELTCFVRPIFNSNNSLNSNCI